MGVMGTAFAALLGATGFLLAIAIVALVERRVAAATGGRGAQGARGAGSLTGIAADALKLAFQRAPPGARGERSLRPLGATVALGAAALGFGLIPTGRGAHLLGEASGALLVLVAMLVAAEGLHLAETPLVRGVARASAATRASAVLGGELAIALSFLGALLAAGTASLPDIAAGQTSILRWSLWREPLALAVCLVASVGRGGPPAVPLGGSSRLAEVRGLAELSGPTLLVASMARRASSALRAALIATLFLGAWNPGFPLPEGLPWSVLSIGVLVAKMAAVLAAIEAWRWLRPPLDDEETARLAWRGLIPLGLANILLVGLK